MLRNDHLLRLAEQVAAALALILVKGKRGEVQAASADCAELCRQHFGLELGTVLRLAPEGLRRLLGQTGAAALARSAALAEILLARGQLAAALGDRATVVPCHVHAFHLLRETTPWVEPSTLAAHQVKLETVADTLRELGLAAYVASESARPVGQADLVPCPSA